MVVVGLPGVVGSFNAFVGGSAFGNSFARFLMNGTVDASNVMCHD